MKLRVLQFAAPALVMMAAVAAGQQPISVSVHLGPGFNAISDPLQNGGNTVSELFPIVPEGTVFYKYDSISGSYSSNGYDPALGGWQINGGFAGSLRPGEGAWLSLQTNLDVTFAGTRLASPPIPTVRLPGYNFVGCPNTQACAFSDVMSFVPAVGDQVFLFDRAVPALPPNPDFAQVASSKHLFGTNGWDVAPVFGVGRAAFVFLADAPRITIQPLRLRVGAGTAAQFNAVAIGGTPTAYRWRFEGALLGGQSGSTLLLQNVGPANEGQYTVEVAFSSGLMATSIAARLFVSLAPDIVRPPMNQSVVQGKPAKFDVVAAGTRPLFYQWQRNGNPLTPMVQDQTNFVIAAVQAADAGDFNVIVSNAVGVAASPAARLNVLIPPIILVSPQSQTVPIGQSVTLTVTVQNGATQPLLYQWQLNGNTILGANGPSLTITNFQPADSGSYRVTVANVADAVQSAAALVLVDLPEFAFSDNVTSAPLLPVTLGVVRGKNVGATVEPGEPRIFGKRGGHSVWAVYAAPATGIVTFRTRGSSIDTLLGAYVGTAPNALAELASDDDSGGFLTSVISFNVRLDNVYFIDIDGFAGAQGQIILSWQLEQTPDLLPVILAQPNDQTVAQGGDAVFNVQPAAGSVVSYQWFFNNQPLPNAIQSSLTVTNVQLNRVGEYFVRLRSGTRATDSRPVDLEINSPDAGPVQSNARSFDKFMDLVEALGFAGAPFRFVPAAGLVLGYTGSQVFNNMNAGGQDGEPVHCDAIGGASRWFAYIPPANGQLFLNTDGSTFDTLLAVYTGCCDFENLTMVGCDNNSGTNGLTSSLSLSASNGVVYYIAVDGVNGARGTVKLNYRLFVPMILTNLSKTTNSLTFKLNATPSYPFTVQRTTNFVNWTAILTTNTSTGNFIFTDTNLPPPKRLFYRGMQVP